MSLKFRTRGGKLHGAVELSGGRVGVYFKTERRSWGTTKTRAEYLIGEVVNGRLVIRPSGAARVISGTLVDV